MKLRTGQICAAFVPYQDEEKCDWIITRIEKSLPNGDYVVKDEYSETQQFKHYTVKPNEVTHFPAINSAYVPGEKVLALWYDKDSREWSTMFYEATVLEVEGPKKIIISFTGSPDLRVQTDDQRLAKFPSDTEMQTEETETQEECREIQQELVNVNRRIIFTAGPVKDGPPEFRKYTDEELTRQMGPRRPVRRLNSVEGTPLIDLLNEPTLFPEVSPHVTVNGSLTLTEILDNGETPEIMKNEVRVGRLSRIMHEWRK